jgi:hypothetical protein
MKNDAWLWALFLLIAGYWLYRRSQQSAIGGYRNSTIPIGNDSTGRLLMLEGIQTQSNTRPFTHAVVVKTAGTPVQFPHGSVPSGEIKVSTRGNTGTVYISDSASTAGSGSNRYGIAKDSSELIRVSELSQLYLDADNDDDQCEIFAQVTVN